ncbi:MAG: Glu-tRNA(Gln) amidotransferase subunit GatD [Nanoarchaeota archaeon]
MANSGDLVKIETKEETFEGVLMPEEKGVVVVKLRSGYNIGIDKSKIKKISITEKRKELKSTTLQLDQNKSLPKISILHTGGTIASKVDYETGGVISRFTPEEIISMFPELKNIAQLSSRLVRNMWSDDMRFAHYNILAKEIEKEVKSGADGIIITHGTDTLHYTGAALSFALENLPIPVILVGAQRSSDRASSDAGMNLICASEFIAKTDFAGVVLCMHDKTSDSKCAILPGVKCRKMHSSRRDAFKAINTTSIATVDSDSRKIDFLRTDYNKKDKNRKLQLKLFDEKRKVGLLKIHTNMYSSEFKSYEGFDGLVIEGTGMGHAPINEIDELTKEHSKIFDSIKNLIKKGTVVAMSTQTIYGSVDMNVYSSGRKLIELGVLGNYTDMHPETAFIKLAWLLSNFENEQVKELYAKNLRGEISENLSVSEE